MKALVAGLVLIVCGAVGLTCAGSRAQSPSPTSTDSAAITLASNFATACQADDLDAVEKLLDPEIHYKPFSFASLCDPIDGCFGTCTKFELANIVATPHCADASPAEAANTYGRRCSFWLSFAKRPVNSSAAYVDGHMCVVVQDKAGKLVVVRTHAGSDPVTESADCT